MKTTLCVNGEWRSAYVEPGAFLLDVLRDEFGLFGVKEGCDEGECGACSVLIDGLTVDSCIYFAAQAEGSRIVTVEGASSEAGLACIQEALAASGAAQCGFCTPGIAISVTQLLAENATPNTSEIRDALVGNLCRCTGYGSVLRAVNEASAAMATDST